MSTRFEVLLNGKQVCLCGIDGDGVLSVGLNYVKHKNKNSEFDLHVGGLGYFDGSQDTQVHAAWEAPDVVTGDEITIRILPEGEFDGPVGMTASPKKILLDSDFGEMSYYIDAWRAEIPFPSPPFEVVSIFIRADDSGPTENQRKQLLELPRRHSELWPEICSALVRCHKKIKASEELEERMNVRVSVNLYERESNSIEMKYEVDGDPESRGYYVTLRDWEIAEVCTAE